VAGTGEHALGRGTINDVARSGTWVLRPARPHTPFVQDLLAGLAEAGCDWAPRAGGLAPGGRERVSFVAGLADWELRARGGDPYAEGAVLAAMRWVRRLHDVTAGPDGRVACHGDLGVHNLIYTWDGGAAGLIDFDLASRGTRVDDLATAVKELARLGSTRPASEQVAAAVKLRDAYGWDAVDVPALLARIPTAFADDLDFCLAQARAGNSFYQEWDRTGGARELREGAARANGLLPPLRTAATVASAAAMGSAG
jgi:hypothetical protein